MRDETNAPEVCRPGKTSLILPTDPSGWRLELSGVRHEFGHTLEYVEAASAVTGFPSALWSYRGPDGKAACAIAMRPAPGGGFDVVTPLGFSGFALAGDVPELGDAWTQDWQRRGAIAAFVQLSPFLGPPEWKSLLPTQAAHLFPAQDCWSWDLHGSENELLMRMTPDNRQRIRKWLREDARIVWDQEELVDAFNGLYPEFVARNRISNVYRFPGCEIRRLSQADGSLFIGARGANGQIESVCIFLGKDARADFFLNASNSAGRRHSRGLYWSAGLRLRELGIETLNLGGGIKPGDSLSEFKRRFGARLAPTLSLRQVFDSNRYDSACRAVGVSPATANYFPAYHSP